MRFRVGLFVLFIFALSIEVIAQNALSFDGSNDYVQTSLEGPTGTKPRSVECWIKTPYQKKQEVMVDYGRYSTGARFTFALIDGKLRVEVFGSGVTGPTTVGDDKWHHVAVTFDNTASPKYRTFIDGKISDSFNITTPINTGNAVNVRIGMRVDKINPFTGLIDEVRIWDYARNHQQIKNHYLKEFCGYENGLIGYHKFNQGVAGKNNKSIDVSDDLSRGKNNGDLENFNLSGTSSNWVAGVSFTQGSVTGSATVSACGKYKSPGGKIITSSGKVIDTIKNYVGCDSILTQTVTIIPNPTKTISATSCKVYLSPSGQFAWNKSGTYTDRISDPNGCDTIVTINLIVSRKSRDTVYANVCDMYTSPSGKYIWDQSGRYQDTLTSIYGCDSIITIYLSLLTSDTMMSLSSCSPVTSPSGKYTWDKTGNYTDTLTNTANCDSIIRMDFRMLEATSSSIDVYRCAKYTSPSDKYTWTQTGRYQDVIPNKSGCDSTIEINLTIGNMTASHEIEACEQLTSPSGRYVWTASGMYMDTIKTSKGCDSFLSIDLTIRTIPRQSMTISMCNSYESPSRKYTWTESGTYLDTLPSFHGCDSIISIDLTIDEMKAVMITKTGESTLEASITDASYQWLDCEDNYAIIDGATEREYSPESGSGGYAVEVTKSSCMDTSDCSFVLSVSTTFGEQGIRIYPNPVSDLLHIDTDKLEKMLRIEVLNVAGKLMLQQTLNSSIDYIDVSALKDGLYLLKMYNENGQSVQRFVKH